MKPCALDDLDSGHGAPALAQLMMLAAIADSLVDVQTAEGKEPQAFVSSEWAALLDLGILADVWQFYQRDEHGNAPVDDEGNPKLTPDHPYIKNCKEFAKLLGVHWTEVHYPFPLSADNDSRHPHGRALMLQPRLSAEQLQKHRDSIAELTAKWLADEMVKLNHGQSIDGLSPALHAALKSAVEQRFYKEYGCTYEQWCWRELAFKMPWLRTLVPEQWMPLGDNTPELHQMVEHMVDTVKGEVKDKMHAAAKKNRLSTCKQDLGLARLYQHWIKEAVQSRGCGAAGKVHIAGSCRKWPITGRLVATPVGMPIMVKHTFHFKKRKRAAVNAHDAALTATTAAAGSCASSENQQLAEGAAAMDSNVAAEAINAEAREAGSAAADGADNDAALPAAKRRKRTAAKCSVHLFEGTGGAKVTVACLT